jgi:hypothetical protein
MKSTITSMLIRNAINYARQASEANKDSKLDMEIYCSIGAHLMMALAIEGIANEIGEAVLPPSLWSRVEKVDTVVKWYTISGIGDRQHFDLSEEPLQTIQRLVSIRNRIAHPKVEDLGDEIIIKNRKGEVRRNVKTIDLTQGGDTIYIGLGKLIAEFSSVKATDTIKKGIDAILKLKKHLGVSGLEWIDDYKEEWSG